jgi:hypothetical protein
MKNPLIFGLVEISPVNEVPRAKSWSPTRGSPRGVVVVSDRRRPLLRVRAPGGDHALRRRE